MAKYTIEHTCGHTETHQLDGPIAARTKREQWLETTVCSACYKQQVMESRVKGAAAATKGLPSLSGASQKQVDYATIVRAEVVDKLTRYADNCTKFASDPMLMGGHPESDRPRLTADLEDLAMLLNQRLNEIKQEASARWWLDNKAGDVVELLVAPVVRANVRLLGLIKTSGLSSASLAQRLEAMVAADVQQEQLEASRAANAAREADGNDPTTRSYYVKRLRELVGAGASMRAWRKGEGRRGVINQPVDPLNNERVYINLGKEAVACYRWDDREGRAILDEYEGDHADELLSLCETLLRVRDGYCSEGDHDLATRLDRIEVPA